MLYISIEGLLSYLIFKHVASLSPCKWLFQAPLRAAASRAGACLLVHCVGSSKPGSRGVAVLCSSGPLNRASALEVFGDSDSSQGSYRADTSLSGQESGCLLRGIFVSPKIDTEKQEHGFLWKCPCCSSVAGLTSRPTLSHCGGWHRDLISVPPTGVQHSMWSSTCTRSLT